MVAPEALVTSGFGMCAIAFHFHKSLVSFISYLNTS